MAKSTNKQAFTLMSLFDDLYLKKYGQEYRGNRHKDKWGFMDMIDDLGMHNARVVVRYYFRTSPSRGHTRQHLIYNYESYVDAIRTRQADREYRRAILERQKELHEG